MNKMSTLLVTPYLCHGKGGGLGHRLSEHLRSTVVYRLQFRVRTISCDVMMFGLGLMVCSRKKTGLWVSEYSTITISF